jgi:ElaB/YqjD/DUF883 family membrane-anchored ribosome-binding protein
MLNSEREEISMASIAPWRRRKSGSVHLEKRLNALQSDLARLQDDLRGLASAGGEVAGESLGEALENAQAGAKIVADRAAKQLGAWTDGNLDPVRKQVRTQPLASVLLSAGAGALVGALLLGLGPRD